MASWKKLLTTGGVAASDIASGTIADGRLPSDCGANTSYLASVPNHSAALITTGTVGDNRLPSECGANTAYLTSVPNHSGNLITSGTVAVAYTAAKCTDPDADETEQNTCDTPNIVQTTVSGNAGTVTNGVYTTGNQTIAGEKTFSDDANFSGHVILPSDKMVKFGANCNIEGATSGTKLILNSTDDTLLRIGGTTKVELNATTGNLYCTGRVRSHDGDEDDPGLQLGSNADGFFHNGGIKVVVNNVYEALFKDGGDFHTDGDVFAFSGSTTSDRRLKTDIEELKDNLDIVMSLEPVRFDWLIKDKSTDIGLIAQDVQKVIPEVVKEVDSIGATGEFLANDTMLTIDYSKLVTVLIGAVQELQEKIEYLEAKI
tara:strand:- start:185 stop:1303 length:1119 start_codon:yes stop_codon:yes gene_type:complete